MSISAFYGSLYPSGSNSTPQLNASTVAQITASGFDTVIFSLMHIGRPGVGSQQLGDLVYNNTPDVVATGGVIQTSFVGQPGSDWAYYMSQLKAGGVKKIYISIGGGSPVQDYGTIAGIMQYTDPTNQTGPYIPTTSNLYQNFQALYTYLPMVDGIDLDQEEGNSQTYTDAMTALGNMALAVGFPEVTLVPPFDSYVQCYTDAGVAINTYGTAMATPLAGAVTRIGLQLYGGCSVSTWALVPATIGTAGGGANPVMTVGASAQGASTTDINNTFGSYVSGFGTTPIAGGFIWEYDYIQSSPACYQQAMALGLAGNTNWPPASGPCS